MKKGQVYEGLIEKVEFPNKGIVSVEGEEKKVEVKPAAQVVPEKVNTNTDRPRNVEGDKKNSKAGALGFAI